MNEIDMQSIIQTVIQLSISTVVLVLITYFLVRAGRGLLFLLRKRTILLRLKKYDLSKHEIHFDLQGLPVTLVEKNSNKIIFI